MDYRGQDGRLIWQVAALVVAGKLAEGWAVDAAEGAKACRATNRPAYFRTVLEEKCAANRVRLKALLREAALPPGCPTGPPAGPPPADPSSLKPQASSLQPIDARGLAAALAAKIALPADHQPRKDPRR